MSEQIQKLTHVQHILKRPDSYVGPVACISDQYWTLVGEKFTLETLKYSPALLKIFDEILVNAIDRNSSFPTEVKKINILVQDNTISIQNDGPLGGICVKQHPTEKIWNPELTFGHLLTSTNYDDTQERLVGGRNGYGAKLANVFSKKFSICIRDSENKVEYTQTWTDNMTKCQEPVMTKYSKGPSSVTIFFEPDWVRFGMKQLDTDFMKIIEKRVYDASFCTSQKCKVTFQGAELPKVSPEVYCGMYLPPDTPVVAHKSERWAVCLAPSRDGFQHVSFVNGICTNKGGTHVDHVASYVAAGIIEELAAKIKLRPQQVKDNFFVLVRATLVNPSFSSQVKSECTLRHQEFGSKFDPPQNFIKSVLRTGIKDLVLALSKFKEQSELKKTDGSAKKSNITGIPKLDDAEWAGTAKSSKCTLIVTEGDSAKALAVAGISVVSRESYGVFPLRGKCKNVRDASVKQLLANQEFNDLKKILGLQQDKVYKSLGELRYGRLMIMTDADNDGSHIKGLILNMIHYFWPSLLDLGFVVSMVTPIIKATKGTQVKSFYTDSAFREWHQTNQGSSWRIKYYKGLGTSTSAEAKEYFKNITQLTVAFDADKDTEKSIVLAFDKTKADDRKKWLLESSSRTDLEVKYGQVQTLEITDFIHKDLVNFSLADLKRSIAHMCDGFKPSQRKVLFACFDRNIKEEMKVAQLSAYVAERTSYHHGEVSLADTIVRLANNFTGSNNINFLEPGGQFGTRLMGGEDAASPRYIFTRLTKESREIFDPRDDAVLTYLDDEGKSIEPEYFVPILPTILVNGTKGIGTGFSCYVPPFNPEDIKKNILNVLSGQDIVPMKPWFRGFKGTVTTVDPQSWVAEGTVSGTTITELPPGVWTQDYKEFLEELKESQVITDYKNNCDDDNVKFTIIGYHGDDFVKDFKLRKTIHGTNMHLFHPKVGIKKYQTAEEILVDFVEIRMDFYKKRKAHLIQELTKKSEILDSKAKFVQLVVDGDFIIFKRKRDAIEKDLARKFPKVDNSYDYLMNIKTYQYSLESIQELKAAAEKNRTELEFIKSQSAVDMWKKDVAH